MHIDDAAVASSHPNEVLYPAALRVSGMKTGSVCSGVLSRVVMNDI